MPRNGLTEMQYTWVLEYVKTFNATQAARKAGYKDPEHSGYENRKNPRVWAHVERELERHGMTVSELTGRLTQIARFNLGPYLQRSGGEWSLNVDQLRDDGFGFMVKQVYPTAHGTRIELHDPVNMLTTLARFWLSEPEKAVKVTGAISGIPGVREIEELTQEEVDDIFQQAYADGGLAVGPAAPARSDSEAGETTGGDELG